MRNREPQAGAKLVIGGKRRLGTLDDDVHRLRHESETRVPQQRSGEEVRLAENLEPVTDAEHRSTPGSVSLYRLHDRAEARDRSGAQVVTVTEPSGQHHYIGALEIGLAM